MLIEMFRSGFLLGEPPSKSRIASKIGEENLVHFDFGYLCAESNHEQLEFDQFSEGFSAIDDAPQGEFAIHDPAPGNLVHSVRIGRSAAFRRIVLRAFDDQCCVCAGSLVDLSGIYETEAAHIVPKRHRGTDDVRNGLALCRQHHWAFDRGMFGIDDDYRILVPAGILSIPENASLAERNGNLIGGIIASDSSPHPSALSWHRNHVLHR